MSKRSRVVVAAGSLAAAGVLFGGFLSPAGSASASGFHNCGSEFGTAPPDDGLVTDLVHHTVEPLAPDLTVGGLGGIHVLNCSIAQLTGL